MILTRRQHIKTWFCKVQMRWNVMKIFKLMLPQLAAVHPLGLHPFSPFWSDWPPPSLLQRSFSPLWSHLLKQPKNLQYIYVTESNVALRLTTFQSSLNINNFNNGLSNLEITYIWNQPVLAFWLESSSFSAPFSSVFSSDSVFVSSVFSSVFVWNFTLLTIKHYTHNQVKHPHWCGM